MGQVIINSEWWLLIAGLLRLLQPAAELQSGKWSHLAGAGGREGAGDDGTSPLAVLIELVYDYFHQNYDQNMTGWESKF